MADKDDLSRLPSFDDYRDPDAPREKPEPAPKLYPSVWKWALAAAVVFGFAGSVPVLLAQLSQHAAVGDALMAGLTSAVVGGIIGAVVGGILGGLRDEYSSRSRKK
jgi:hypothetical protein